MPDPMILRSANPFSLRDLAFSHGWIALPPWSWRTDPPAIRRVERLPSGAIASVEILTRDAGVPADTVHIQIAGRVSDADRALLDQRVRWMLRLDENLEEFHTL